MYMRTDYSNYQKLVPRVASLIFRFCRPQWSHDIADEMLLV